MVPLIKASSSFTLTAEIEFNTGASFVPVIVITRFCECVAPLSSVTVTGIVIT